jgi:hypothetical protein
MISSDICCLEFFSLWRWSCSLRYCAQLWLFYILLLLLYFYHLYKGYLQLHTCKNMVIVYILLQQFVFQFVLRNVFFAREIFFVLLYSFIIIIILLFFLLLYDMDVSCHRSILPGTSLERAVNPTAQASSFTLLHTAVLSVLCVMFQV